MEKFKRKKKFNLINSFFYYLDKILPISYEKKIKFYFNLDFIFKRLAYENSYKKFKDIHPTTQNTINNIKKYIKKNFKILDLGCGNGIISYSLSNFVKEITSIDYDKNIIENAKKKFAVNNLKFYYEDIKNLNRYKFKNLDLIICSHIIEHLDKPFDFLKTLKKFNSQIYIEVPDLESDNLYIVKKKLNLYLTYNDNDHIYEFNRDYLLKKLKDHNFKILDQDFRNGVISLLVK